MSKTQQELTLLLEQLIGQGEHEVIEFKRAANNYDLDKLGQYVSALANEANLRSTKQAWLVFGVHDEGSIEGTQLRSLPRQLGKLKHEIAQGTSLNHGIREIHELLHAQGRVLLCEIAPAPAGIPVAWKGKYCARDGESLSELNISKLDEIRMQISGDWSAETVAAATISDLDPGALGIARETFVDRNPSIPVEEVNSWSDAELLDALGLLVGGQLTRAAILLLGDQQASRYFGQIMPEITWVLSDEDRVYEHFGLPFLTVGTRVYERVRNYQIRLLQPDALLQTEVQKYDRQSILEAIHNCIAHMNYRDGARTLVEEHEDKLVIENPGEFYDGEPQDYLLGKRRARRYRNPALVQAMTKLYMIDHVGFGIKRIGSSQTKRFLPLPDYLLAEDSVRLTIYGAQIDTNYSELLMQRTDLDLVDIFALDRVQKSLPIDADALRRLRRLKLVEGRAPRVYISAAIASATGAEAEYMRVRDLEDMHLMTLISDYVAKFGPAPRADLDAFIWEKLHASLTDAQKDNKVKHLLRKLKAEGRVEVIGAKRGARWQIPKTTG